MSASAPLLLLAFLCGAAAAVTAAALASAAARQPRAACMLALQLALVGASGACVGRLRLDRAARSAYVGAAIVAYGCSMCESLLCSDGSLAARAAAVLGAPVMAGILTAALEDAALGPPALALRADSPDSCAVCLDACAAGQLCRRLLCGHCFHAGCIDPWAKIRATCPTCRAALVA